MRPRLWYRGVSRSSGEEKHSYKKIVGLEIDERLAWVSGINLFVHGASSFEMKCVGNGGTLGKAGLQYKKKFDAIITNPPFGSDYSDKQGLELFLRKGKASRRRGVLFH